MKKKSTLNIQIVSLLLIVGLGILTPCAARAAETDFVDEIVTVTSNEFTVIDFALPRAGNYEVSAFTEGEEVGGVAQLFDTSGSELYSIPISSNQLPIEFEVMSADRYSFVLRLGPEEPVTELRFVVTDSVADPGSSNVSTSAKVIYRPKPKVATGNEMQSSAKTSPTSSGDTDIQFANKYSYLYFVEQSKVFNAVFGSSWKNVFGFRSRTIESNLGGLFIFTGKIPKDSTIKIEVEDIPRNSKKPTIFKVPAKSIHVSSEAGINKVSFTTTNGLLRGDSLYQARLFLSQASTGKVIYYKYAQVSLDYHMSLACSASLLMLSTTRDTSKGFQQAVDLAVSATNFIFADIVKKTPIANLPVVKKNRIIEKLLRTNQLNNAAMLSRFGSDLIDYAGAYREGDKVKMRLIVKKRLAEEIALVIDDKLKEGIEVTPYGKSASFYLTFTQTKDQAQEFLAFLSDQAIANGDAITNTCAR